MTASFPTPLAHLDTVAAPDVECVDFDGLQIAFDSRVLHPRPWVVAQSLWGAELLETLPGGRVLELCAGVGHIGLRTVVGSTRSLVCVEADPVAAAYCSANALAAGLATRVEVREAPLVEALADDERFALVVADPPYLTTEGVAAYPEDPRLAVDGGPDGLAVARECLAVAAGHLVPGGSCLLQLRDGEQALAAVGCAAQVAPSLRAVETRVYGGHGVVVRLDAD